MRTDKRAVMADDTASAAKEYSLVAALVAVVALPLWQVIGVRLSDVFVRAMANFH
jgi:Flp pilus assembly pilin Flp